MANYSSWTFESSFYAVSLIQHLRIGPMNYVPWGSLAIFMASIGAILWYRTTLVQYAFAFLGLSLFSVPAILGATASPSVITPSVMIGMLLLLGSILHYRFRAASLTSTQPTEPQSAGSQRLSHYPFLLALSSLLVGGLTFLVGLSAAFNREGNWANHLAESGVVLFFLAALSNITAFEAGSISLIREKKFHFWLPVSFIGLLGTIGAAWMAAHL